LCACAGPIGQQEAQSIATARMTKYCGDAAVCKPLRLTKAQKLKDRWLVDFDAPTHTYGVIVEADGNTTLSIWDKTPAPR
jgi:hypothetical protein